jgi:hypothetical protein
LRKTAITQRCAIPPGDQGLSLKGKGLLSMKIDRGEHMAKGKKRPAELPEYGTVMMKGVQYYRNPDYRCRRKESGEFTG